MKKNGNIMDLLALMVFLVFSLCVLAVLLTGAGVYRGLVSDGKESYRTRTACQYVTTRVRQAENARVEEFGACQALVMEEAIDGERYVTRVYCLDGYLRELFSPGNAALSPEDGEPVMEVESLTARAENGLLTVQLDSRQLVLRLSDGEEASP